MTKVKTGQLLRKKITYQYGPTIFEKRNLSSLIKKITNLNITNKANFRVYHPWYVELQKILAPTSSLRSCNIYSHHKRPLILMYWSMNAE